MRVITASTSSRGDTSCGERVQPVPSHQGSLVRPSFSPPSNTLLRDVPAEGLHTSDACRKRRPRFRRTADPRHTKAGGGYWTRRTLRSDAFWIASKHAVAREGEIETGIGGPPIANAVRHARRKLLDISFLPEAVEYQIVCEFRNQYREFESTSLRHRVSGFSHSPEKYANCARVVAICTSRRHRRTLKWFAAGATSTDSTHRTLLLDEFLEHRRHAQTGRNQLVPDTAIDHLV